MSTAPKYWIVKGLSPTGQGTCDFLIPHAKVEHFQRYGPEHKFYELKLVKEILEFPVVIFEGLRENQEEGLCYAGVASGRYNNTGTKLPAPPKKTFVVFTTSDYKVFQWRWEDDDPEMAGYPLNWRIRFGSQKWPTT